MPMRSLAPWSGRRSPTSDIFNQFEEFINEFDRNFSPTYAARSEYDFTPPVDLAEGDNAYTIYADLPGMKKSDIKLDFNNNVLTISGERLREAKGEGKFTERVYGKFQRSFSLPAQVNADKIQAHFEDGVLEITVPKAEGARSHSIKIM